MITNFGSNDFGAFLALVNALKDPEALEAAVIELRDKAKVIEDGTAMYDSIQAVEEERARVLDMRASIKADRDRQGKEAKALVDATKKGREQLNEDIAAFEKAVNAHNSNVERHNQLVKNQTDEINARWDSIHAREKAVLEDEEKIKEIQEGLQARIVAFQDKVATMFGDDSSMNTESSQTE